jgi:GR25 family glycosyltransferase involved in LPS biosynthesis
MDYLAKEFLQKHDEFAAINLIKVARCNKFNHLGVLLAKFMESEFPCSVSIKEEHAIMLYYSNKYQKAYFAFQRLLKLPNLTEEKVNSVVFNQHFSIDAMQNRYIYYDPRKMRKILSRTKKAFPKVTVTMTSCKRLNLFTQTVNSFINCCKDIELVDEWICVDDNSSQQDREEMKALYPFMTFIFKSHEEKGHPRSMNIIRDKVSTPYIFHMEDDWRFFEPREYISQCLEILGQDPKIGQCLINKNYSEIGTDKINGGIFKVTPSGLRYYIHEFCHTKEQQEVFTKKHGAGPNCSYWPHFSFRPSLIRTHILKELGRFDENISHFEMEYSNRYVNKGYISAFLEAIYCTHIGRLTSERFDKSKLNAYDLNNEAQLSGKEEKRKLEAQKQLTEFPFRLKTFVVNLDRRPDRMENFEKHEAPKFLNYKRFSAVDGSKMIPTAQLQQIFDHNDYNMRKGMVGCAMSHLKLCVELLKDENTDVYCILEDDIDFVPEFEKKLLWCASELHKTNWDMFYLGHHLWKHCIDNEVYSKTLWPKVEQFDRAESLRRSMGGTIGYMITKKGAEKLLEFINRNGMTNGIDTVQQKSADELNIFYAYPHLIYSECFRGNNNLDTDIQYNYDSLTMSIEERLQEELKNYNQIIKIGEKHVMEIIVKDCLNDCYYESDNQTDIISLTKMCKYPYYTLDDKVLFVSPEGTNNGRYYHRFKKNDDWNINDAIQYKSD